MTGKKSLVGLLSVLLALAISAGALGGQEIEATSAVCEGCHGAKGLSQNPLVPTLAGQPYTLIEDNLLAFRGGYRACAPGRHEGSPSAVLAQTMCTTVSGLSDAEISALASYFEAQNFQPAVQEFDAAQAQRGAVLHEALGCEQCHSDGGRTTNDMAPILGGQWLQYLRGAMDALRSGTREGPTMMNEAIKKLDHGEAEALLNYYASQVR